jgi:hypothetical protein
MAGRNSLTLARSGPTVTVFLTAHFVVVTAGT